MISPLIRDFETVYPGGRGQSFGRVRRKMTTLFYQKIIKNITLTVTSCLDSTAMAYYWAIHTQHSCFSDVSVLETRGCNSARVTLGIS